MLNTLNRSALFAGLLILAATLLCGGAGLWAQARLVDVLSDSQRSSQVLFNHAMADMMHDAIRADVLSAIAATDSRTGLSLADAQKDLAEHVSKFHESVKAARALAVAPEEQQALDALGEPLETYAKSAQDILAAIAQSPDLAMAKLPDFFAQFSRLEDSMEKASEVITAAADHDDAVAKDVASMAQIVCIGGLALALLVTLGLSQVARLYLVRPLITLSNVLDRLAGGQHDAEIPVFTRRDEIGRMARAIGNFRTAIREKARSDAEMDHARMKEQAQRDAEREAANAAMQNRIVSSLATGLSSLAKGDLAVRLNEPFPSGYDMLRKDFNEAVQSLSTLVVGVMDNATAIQGGSGEIARGADDLARRTERQAASLKDAAVALDDITATVNLTADGANQASMVVQGARGDADQSRAVVQQSVAAMSELEASARQIGRIVGVIGEIAYETNILALNASLEASRAGAAGVGFAVVASEVRVLAQRAAKATAEIVALITTSEKQVAVGVDLVTETGAALERVVGRIAEIDGVMREIASSAQKQSAGLRQVNATVTQMDAVTQQNAALVLESTSASHTLAAEADALSGLIGRFRVSASGNTPAIAERRRA